MDLPRSNTPISIINTIQFRPISRHHPALGSTLQPLHQPTKSIITFQPLNQSTPKLAYHDPLLLLYMLPPSTASKSPILSIDSTKATPSFLKTPSKSTSRNPTNSPQRKSMSMIQQPKSPQSHHHPRNATKCNETNNKAPTDLKIR